MNTILINKKDNVCVALNKTEKGDVISDSHIVALENIQPGHKIAVKDIEKNQDIIKYGYPIGHATKKINAGEHVHIHNVSTNLNKNVKFEYLPSFLSYPKTSKKSNIKIKGFRRKNGKFGIRNDILIIPTVGCINKSAEKIANISSKAIEKFNNAGGVFAFPHPFGCSQYGKDNKRTKKLLSALITHPNSGGVLVLSLGCEHITGEEIKNTIGEYDKDRIKFLCAQDVKDEIKEGVKLVEQLSKNAAKAKIDKTDISELVVGMKCGGSDAFSGITANPIIGRVSDKLNKVGASVIITETAEMFGAEQILLNRCVNKNVFNKSKKMMKNMKNYYVENNVPVDSNPSPGNIKGGITTLEEKSLGCVQKGGRAVILDMVDYAEPIKHKGLNLLNGPCNDMVSVTNLAAAGAHLVVFSTGRGTPFGGFVPTLKVSTNSNLYEKKSKWIDFNAGGMLNGEDINSLSKRLFNLILKAVESDEILKNEINGYREIAIFKDGVSG